MGRGFGNHALYLLSQSVSIEGLLGTRHWGQSSRGPGPMDFAVQGRELGDKEDDLCANNCAGALQDTSSAR